MDIRYWSRLDEAARLAILKRSESDIDAVLDQVRRIVDEVRHRGDHACRRFSREFDGIDLDKTDLVVTPDEISEAEERLNPEVKDALTRAIDQVRVFHSSQREKGFAFIETAPGLYVAERMTPIDSVGLYVPRGRGSFPSMLYMLAVPAQIAGVPDICVATPPLEDGSVDPASLYAAAQCGVTRVVRAGGAQAIAAMSYGTESIARVEKIVGPGSAYVAAAKRVVRGHVDVGLPAGPSESVVLADDSASPRNIALDLTIEAEHGSDSQALLVTPSTSLAKTVIDLLDGLIDELPEPRRGFVRDVLSGYGGVIVTETMDEAVDLVDRIAPEHLSIQTRDPFAELSEIGNAGEILLGEHTPFSLANYAAGANAVLPTGGAARTYSPVSVRDFSKYSSVVYATAGALQAAAHTVTTLADYEGFPAHARAIRRRSGE